MTTRAMSLDRREAPHARQWTQSVSSRERERERERENEREIEREIERMRERERKRERAREREIKKGDRRIGSL